MRLPSAAHAALRFLQAQGTHDEFERMTRQVTLAILDARHEITQRRMNSEGAASVVTEDDIVAEAFWATYRSRCRS